MKTENIEYISELTFDTKSNLYNLNLTTFSGLVNVLNFTPFFCERKHAMRLDLVSDDIYSTTKWTGSLCQLNDILNPFSIRDGDILFYLPEADLQALLKIPDNVTQAISTAKQDLINVLKKKQPDGLRRNYLTNRGEDKLPPTVFTDTTPQIVIDNNKIKISPNLFTNPNTEPTTVQPDSISPLQNAPSSPAAANNDIERVLVRRFVKLINK